MRVLRLAVAAVAVTGCGGGDGGGGTPPPPAVSSVTITPATAQSITVGGTVGFSAQAKDAQGNNLNRTVTWTTSDASKVSLSATTGASVTATGVAAGSSQITATSELKPSTAVTVTVAAPSSTANVVASSNANTFVPDRVDIVANGTVTWTFGSRPHNVIFSASKPPGGDIGTPSSGVINTTESRTFPTAGNFPYDCTLHAGMKGTVVVH